LLAYRRSLKYRQPALQTDIGLTNLLARFNKSSDLQLVDLITDIKFAVVFDEVRSLLWASHRTPMRQYPRQTIRSNELPARAGVQLGPFPLSHFAPQLFERRYMSVEKPSLSTRLKVTELHLGVSHEAEAVREKSQDYAENPSAS
jgi:hypothetical protein